MKNIFEQTPDREGTPFENIALTFSGGGFRAASFALGVLSYLNQLKQRNNKPLLENVSYISSASGGTITNAMYAQASASGKPFKKFYNSLFENLTGTKLLETVFDKLNKESGWKERPNKKQNLINAFALAYDENLFNGEVLGCLCRLESSTHLDEVCFNTTELYRGLLFRQNVKLKSDKEPIGDSNFRYGNSRINIKEEVAAKLKISDVLAASSCFPAGFEPVIFPDDFTYNKTNIGDSRCGELDSSTLLAGLNIQLNEMKRSELERIYGKKEVAEVIKKMPKEPTPEDIKKAVADIPISSGFKFGLMDGGITDNQALESVLDAHERRLSQNQTSFRPFDLILVNDVSSDFMDPWQPDKANSSYTGWKGITIYAILIISSLLFAVGIGMLVSGFVVTFEKIRHTQLMILFGTLITLLSGMVVGTLLAIRFAFTMNMGVMKRLNLDKNFSKSIRRNLFSHFGSTSIVVIFRMIKERFTSILVLNNDVFLKRIRFLLYNIADKSDRYKDIVQANHIFDLSYSNDGRDISGGKQKIIPGNNIKKVAQTAFELGTHLWFDQNKQKYESKAAVIAAGHASTCYNLLLYIYKLKSSGYADLTQDYKDNVDFLENNLKADFAEFNSDPF